MHFLRRKLGIFQKNLTYIQSPVHLCLFSSWGLGLFFKSLCLKKIPIQLSCLSQIWTFASGSTSTDWHILCMNLYSDSTSKLFKSRYYTMQSLYYCLQLLLSSAHTHPGSTEIRGSLFPKLDFRWMKMRPICRNVASLFEELSSSSTSTNTN